MLVESYPLLSESECLVQVAGCAEGCSAMDVHGGPCARGLGRWLHHARCRLPHKRQRAAALLGGPHRNLLHHDGVPPASRSISLACATWYIMKVL
jgi:hypothetical protein